MSRRALIVDDSRATRALLKRLLVSLEFEVSEACDGLDGLKVLQQIGEPVLFLVDWHMPHMDGLEFIKSVRSDRLYERSVVVMVTSESETVHITRALMAGADEYAIKPVTIDALRDKLAVAGVVSAE